ncbi:Gamma-glutamyltranspeptidase [Rhodovastum atsumiense]|uniref:Gamma-glutamyltranspeptidase n=1 Tax=Rhodovastum atsumiense TaxID=504468 RepID=A0A5M6ILH2_9PROT|nr:gamma-glutamyltransferase [Rhodovastum atsumiense]KAA5609120.1 gamma-glutamyltranspeptidase [Rhodovastum atsumiense]CAH2603798.1 Gamma-glutamyltranspeptidase [Rhodovastum atsumiense]
MDGKAPLIASRQGMVAAAHPLAAAAGVRILGRGGNAFDAAVATAAALGVVEPGLSGLGGGGMATCWVAADHRARTLGFTPVVPARFPGGGEGGTPSGGMAVAAPGALAGWYDLLSAHGTLTLAQVLAPAIELAEDGIPVVGCVAATLAHAARELRDSPCFAAWDRIYGAGGRPRPGAVLRQPALAATLTTIAAEGPRALHGGRLGQALVAQVQALGGVLSLADLEAVSARWERPVSMRYRDLVLHVPPPPGRGGELLLALGILDDVDLAAMECGGVAHLDAVWRAMRLAAMERAAGEDLPEEAQPERWLADDTLERLRLRARDGEPVEGAVEPWQAPQPHTTALAVADRMGNLVCITQTLGSAFGGGVVVPELGLCLNNALSWGRRIPPPTGARPAGGRRIATPIAPVLATRNRRPWLALGSPGGWGISQVLAQALVRIVDFAEPLQQAIEAPRARLWDGRRVTAEDRIAPAVLEALRARGHDVTASGAWSEATGAVQAVAIDAVTGVITGAADPRRDGYAAGI